MNTRSLFLQRVPIYFNPNWFNPTVKVFVQILMFFGHRVASSF